MIIKCPNCAFSGRVPGYVADAPHHARCPKCRFGFDVGDLVAHAPEFSEPPASESSSSNSSYEIETINDVWEDEEEPAPKLSPKPALAAPPPLAPATLQSGVRLLDWRVHLLEGWAAALLVWAALIALRAIYATLARGDELVFSQALFWPVAAVVLLVAAAAGLLLALGLGQRLASGPDAVVKAAASTRGRRLARAKDGTD